MSLEGFYPKTCVIAAFVICVERRWMMKFHFGGKDSQEGDKVYRGEVYGC